MSPKPFARRIAAGFTALGFALGLSAVVAPPAHAVEETVTPNLSVKPYRYVGVYGAYQDFSGEGVTYKRADGSEASATGVVVLQRYKPNGGGWVNIDRDDSPGFMLFDNPGSRKFLGNSFYRVIYSGGSDYYYHDGVRHDVTFRKVISNRLNIRTYLNLRDTYKTTSTGNIYLQGDISPASWTNRKVIVQVKRAKWETYKVVRSTSTSRYSARVAGSRNGTYYRVYVPGNDHFLSTRARNVKAYRY